MRIEITKDHIHRGRPGHADSSPVALAVKERLYCEGPPPDTRTRR